MHNNINLSQMFDSKDEFYRNLKDNIKKEIRVCMPGEIVSFDCKNQTATVMPLLLQKTSEDTQNFEYQQISPLLDVQVILPRCNNFVLTFPLSKGDEGILIFMDNCYNLVWDRGGVQAPEEERYHDLSDAIFIPTIFSNPKNIKNYSSDSTQLRNIEGNSYIEFKGNEINLVGDVKINGNAYSSHTHNVGDSTTGIPK